MKVPPRITFMCQIVPTLWTSIVQIAVMNWTLGNIDEVCTPYVLIALGYERQSKIGSINNLAPTVISLRISHVQTDEHSFRLAWYGVCIMIFLKTISLKVDQ